MALMDYALLWPAVALQKFGQIALLNLVVLLYFCCDAEEMNL